MTPRLITAITLLAFIPPLLAQAPPDAIAAFNTYAALTESRLAQQYQSPSTFLANLSGPQAITRLQHGNLIIEQLTPPIIPGALLHHWRGTAFIPGATVAQLDHLLRDIPAYPQHFTPQITQAHILSQQPGHLQASMRVVQHHILTVALDTTYDITFAHLDPQHAFSLSRSTHIAEIASPNTGNEHALPSSDDHGFLWRLNTYWSYEERDGGLTMQVESISLTRSIPRGLAWAIQPYTESIPRESLEFTLHSTLNALHP
jgi:hypothetical protein